MVLKRIIVVSLICIFFLGLFADVGIELAYSFAKPRIPESETGRVLQLTINHGSKVYVSQAELLKYCSIQSAGTLSMLGSFLGVAVLKLSFKNIWN